LGLQGFAKPAAADAAAAPSAASSPATSPKPSFSDGDPSGAPGRGLAFAARAADSSGLPTPVRPDGSRVGGSAEVGEGLLATMHKDDGDGIRHLEKARMHSPSVFYLGTGLFVCGSLLTFASFGFAAQSLLASLEGVQFVSNVAFAKLIRKQPVTGSVVLGVGMIVLGVATVVLVGNHSTHVYSVRHLTRLYVENSAYQAFLVVVGGSAVVLRYTEKAFSKRAAQGRPWPYSRTVVPVTYAAFSAVFGTQSVVQAKCLMMAITLTTNGDNQVRLVRRTTLLPVPCLFFLDRCALPRSPTHASAAFSFSVSSSYSVLSLVLTHLSASQFGNGFLYAMLVWWAITGYVWLARMGKALKRFDPMFIIPLLQVGFILLAIVSGGIYFQEFETFGAHQAVGFFAGVLLVCAGLYFLAPAQV
jgi:hypothetical protein